MSVQLTDITARKVETIWKKAFPDATLFPGIGLPSQDNGVLFLTHTLNLGKVLKINGLPSSSPLASNSLYSAEVINGKYFNIYEVLMPDIPGLNGDSSTAEIYIKALIKEGLTPAGLHSHWTGQHFFDGVDPMLKPGTHQHNIRDHNVPAMHHQQYDMDPLEFSTRTIRALITTVKEIKHRIGKIIPDRIDNRTCGINNRFANKILNLWKEYFEDTFILPVVGYPSNNNNKVAVYSHTMGDGMLMQSNGLKSKSPLANNALYSFECTRGKFLHFYEIMIPDIPGKNGRRSTAQIYINALRDNGLDVSGVHWHFWGGVMQQEDRGVFAIHHQNIGMTPEEFSRATIDALQQVMEVINNRTYHNLLNNKQIKERKIINSHKSKYYFIENGFQDDKFQDDKFQDHEFIEDGFQDDYKKNNHKQSQQNKVCKCH